MHCETVKSCYLESSGLASANLTDKQETYPDGQLEGSGWVGGGGEVCAANQTTFLVVG